MLCINQHSLTALTNTPKLTQQRLFHSQPSVTKGRKVFCSAKSLGCPGFFPGAPLSCAATESHPGSSASNQQVGRKHVAIAYKVLGPSWAMTPPYCSRSSETVFLRVQEEDKSSSMITQLFFLLPTPETSLERTWEI